MKKKTIMLLVIVGVLLVVGIGASFAYFASNSQNDGNNTNLNQTTEELGSILWDGTKVFTSFDLLPGEIGIQEFTIEKDSEKGHGIYEIDLEATVPEEFRSDIEITLYKTTDIVTNNVTVNKVDPTLENEQIYQEDSLNITGSPELIYQGSLVDNPQIILEQADFDVTTLEKTTYYLVYHYKNNGNQDDQQGKTFTGTISVRIIKEKIQMKSVDKILSLAETNPEQLVYDGTTDNNLRYIGANPNNYVSFNNELWRIIGVMNNIDDGTGTKETRLKIIRDEPYKMVWDTGDVSNWATASSQKELNSTYLSSIQSLYKEMIGSAVWNLGGSKTYEDVTAGTFYKKERGTEVYTGRPTIWKGKIGLMYPSDYGYATSGGNTTDRNTCLAKYLYNWNNYSDCYNNDWLYDSSYNQWTLTPNPWSSSTVFCVHSNGFGSRHAVNYEFLISPTLYLSSNVKISGGDGSESNPFTLVMS